MRMLAQMDQRREVRSKSKTARAPKKKLGNGCIAPWDTAYKPGRIQEYRSDIRFTEQRQNG